MKKLFIILGLLSVIVLSGCGTDTSTTQQQRYDKVKSGCTMDGYVVITHPDYYQGSYICISEQKNYEYKFNNCSKYCDRATDDYRDVGDLADITIGCLELCIGENNKN